MIFSSVEMFLIIQKLFGKGQVENNMHFKSKSSQLPVSNKGRQAKNIQKQVTFMN